MVIHLCLLLSGATALVYQIVWTRQFALVFGTTEVAVATVLAANMAGLAFGAALIERCLYRVARPLRWYAALELCIALSALLWVPACLWLSERALLAAFGAQVELPAGSDPWLAGARVTLAFIALGLPAALMGAILPLLARHAVHTDAEVGPRIGSYYAANTAGAVAGALAATTLLLPALGLRRSLWSAALLNLLIAAIALALARGAIAPLAAGTRSSTIVIDRSGVRVLPLMLLAGSLSFAHEVLWTRLLEHLFGSSLHAFGVMLACFLAGIVIGGALGAALARTRGGAASGLATALLATAFAAIWGWMVVGQWQPLSESLQGRLAFAALALLPLTIASGATYPLAVRVLADSAQAAASASARVYAWNTIGAIGGALGAAFLLLPRLRYEGALQALVVAALLLAVGAAWSLGTQRRRFAIALSIAALVASFAFRPGSPEALLRRSPLQHGTGGELLYYALGRSTDVVVLRDHGELLMRSNGLPEASMRVAGRPELLPAEGWMAPLATLARPDARDMLIVGLGSGRLIEAVPPSISRIDVVELEPRVIEANRAIRALRAQDPLADPRLHLVVNDARSALAASSRRYDLILSQPSYPWTARASHLYTREFVQQARQHLRSGGVFVQWMNAGFLDATLLRSLLATLDTVFLQVRAYRTSADTLLLLASDAALDIEADGARLQAVIARDHACYAALGIQSAADLLAALVLDNEGAHALAQGAAVLTDDDNRLATTPAVDHGGGLAAAQLDTLLLPHDPLLGNDRRQTASGLRGMDPDYLGRRWLERARGTAAWPAAQARVARLADVLPARPEQAYLRALLARESGRSSDAAALLQQGLLRWPDSDLLRYALLDTAWGAIAFGNADADSLHSAAALHGDAAVVRDAARAEAQGRWEQVRALDEALSRIPATSLTFAQAALLRADWRALVTDPGARRQRTTEALQILDAALLIAPEARLYAGRVWSLAAAERNAELVEAIDDYATTAMTNAATLATLEKQRLRRDLQAMDRLLQGVPSATAVRATVARAMPDLN